MTTVTRTPAHSAYPRPVEDLIPQARALAAQLGEIPSRNRLMSALRVGAPKANAIRAALGRHHDGAAPEAGEDRPASPSTIAEPARPHLVSVPDAGGPTASAPEAGPDPAPSTPGPTTPEAAHLSHEASTQASTHADPDTNREARSEAAVTRPRPVRAWPVLLLAAPAFVAIWSGWVGLGGLTGFGVVHPLPGLWDNARLNTAITLPIGVETYAAYALRVWLSGWLPSRARRFARSSAIGALALGALGQVTYHLMAAAGVARAPWPITTLVACLPVAVLGMGAALAHLLHIDNQN